MSEAAKGCPSLVEAATRCQRQPRALPGASPDGQGLSGDARGQPCFKGLPSIAICRMAPTSSEALAEVSQGSQGQPAAARGCRRQPGASRGYQGQPGAAGGFWAPPAAARGRQKLAGRSRDSQGLPRAAQVLPRPARGRQGRAEAVKPPRTARGLQGPPGAARSCHGPPRYLDNPDNLDHLVTPGPIVVNTQ